MIVTMKLPSGRTVHVCSNNEPVFTAQEIALMVQGDYTPEAADFLAHLKTVFPGLKLAEVQQLHEETKGDSQMAFLGFNVDEAPDTQDFGVIPAGDYTAIITGSELLSNKAQTGSYLKLEITIADGKYQGRKLFENLNLDNPSAQAVEIARGTLKKIAIACGKNSGMVNESEELHDIPMIINVGIEKRKDNGEDSNRIKSYRSITAAPVAQRAAPTPSSRPEPAASVPPPARAAAGGGRPAWAR